MFDCLTSRGKEAQRRRWKQISGSANQKRYYQDKSIRQANQSRPRRKDKVPFSSNQIRLAGRQGGRLVIRTSCFGAANRKPLDHPFGRSARLHLHIGQSHPSNGSYFGRFFVSTNHILRTDHPSDRLSYRPITSFGRIILRTDFRISQSHPSDGPSFARTFVLANHILWTDHPSDGLFVSANHILWTDHPSEGLFVLANHITLMVIKPLYYGHILRRIYKIGWSDPQA